MVPEPDSPTVETESEWDATWAGTRRAQSEATLSATPEQRLAWLEEAMRFAHASGALQSQSKGRVEPRLTDDN